MATALNPALARGSYIDGLAKDFLLTRAPGSESPNDSRRDDQWIRQSFIVPADGLNKPYLDKIDIGNRKFSSASLKYTDSSLGGNTCINPPPQFTRYADIRDPGIRPNSAQVTVGFSGGELGMGRYYSEAIDDNNQVIHLRFGVPQFNSLTQFFTGFYSSKAGTAARQGRFSTGFINSFLETAGQILSMALVPLAIIPVAILMAGSAFRFFMNWPTSKFYTLKPSMPLYWSAVTSMVNQIGSNQGLITFMDERQKESIIGQEHVFRQAEMGVLSSMLKEFSDKGTIDVYAIANKAKRLEMHYDYMRAEMFANSSESSDVDAFFGVVKSSYSSEAISKARHPYASGIPGIEAYLTRFTNWLGSKTGDNDGVNGVEQDIKGVEFNNEVAGERVASYDPETKINGFFDYFLANQGDGSDWASFRVDYTGPVSESFSNSVAESSLAQKINSLSSSTRDIRMNYSGAIESIPGLSTLKGAIDTVVGGVADKLHLEGLYAAAGSAFVDIPKHWESSAAQLPKSTYTMTLVSPYGNPVSQLFNIWLPLSMLLAGALPLSTGKQSHTSPFLVELHDRGRCMTRLGIIDSLSITRGTANLGFNNEGNGMAVDVSFTVLDLSSIVSMPIVPGFSAQPLEGLFDGDNAFSDYLMALSGMKLGDTIYRIPMLKYQVNRKLADLKSFFAASHIAAYTANLPGVNMLSAIMKGVGNSKE